MLLAILWLVCDNDEMALETNEKKNEKKENMGK